MSSWSTAHENILFLIHKYCILLTSKYHKNYKLYKHKLYKYRIPVIIMSSLVGTLSISNVGYFPQELSKYISLSVGLVNLIISCITVIEHLKKIDTTMIESYISYEKFQAISNEIAIILRIPRDQRGSNGYEYIKNTFARFQQTLSDAPVLKKETKNFLELNSGTYTEKLNEINIQQEVSDLSNDDIISNDINNNFLYNNPMRKTNIDNNDIIKDINNLVKSLSNDENNDILSTKNSIILSNADITNLSIEEKSNTLA